VFFVLSGFLIIEMRYDTRGESRFFRRFYARRSLRIFPVYYLVTVLLLGLTPIFH
jgi:peptidoglycan/LPS O-acetylase OafA/YrhL